VSTLADRFGCFEFSRDLAQPFSQSSKRLATVVEDFSWHRAARAEETARWQRDKAEQFASMSNESLVAIAKFYTRQMAPLRVAADEPIYGVTIAMYFLPLFIGQLEERH
jgi:hypothetical protein